ncbi:YkvI family membrane protein [Thermococcus sp.]
MSKQHKYGVFYRWFLPAIIFQSVYMGGGFTTGREVMEYAGKYGVYGIYSIIMVTIGFLVAAALSYELARVFKAFDYRTWIKQILWKFWPAFDIAYIILAIIVIAVVGSAAASILEDMFHLPYMLGAIVIISAVGLLHFYGRRAIEAFETIGTIILYLMYALLWAITLKAAWGNINLAFAQGLSSGTPGQAAVAGIQYFAYNMVVIPAVLFTLDRLESRKDSLMAGIISSAFVMIAFILTWLSLLGFYTNPKVVNANVPWYEIMKIVGGLWLRGFYVLAVFWTLIETGTGMIHSIVRRIDVQLKEAKGIHLNRKQEATIATVIIILAIAMAKFGIIALVAKGYGTLAWVFFAIYFIPLVTVGVIRILNPEWKKELWSRA